MCKNKISCFTCIVVVLLTLLFISDTNYAQKYFTHLYTEADGLASSIVYDVVQDTNGKMWFTTQAGISCYDGSKWTTYRLNKDLKIQSHNKLLLDAKGKLWALPYSGDIRLTYFNVNKWEDKYHNDLVEQENKYIFFDITYTDNKPFIAIGSKRDGVFLFKNGQWKHYTNKNGLPDSLIVGLSIVNNEVFVATRKGISVIRDDSLINNYFGNINKVPSSPLYGFSAILDSASGEYKFWLCYEDKIGYIFRNSYKMIDNDVNLMFDNKHYNAFIYSADNKGIYFGNTFYLFYYDFSTKQIKKYGISRGLISEGATSVYIDREGNDWITSFRGVTKIPSKRFSNFSKDNGLYDNEVTSIAEIEPGYYVFGHYGALTFYDGKDFTPLVIRNIKNGENIHKSRIQDIAVDKNKNLWVAASYMGLARIDDNKKVTWFDKDNGLIRNVSSVIVDGNQTIWACSDHGLFKKAGNQFIYKPISKNRDINRSLRKIFKGKDGSIYLGSHSSGLIKIKNDSIIFYQCPFDHCGNNVYSFHEDSRGTKWVGTLYGLHRIENDHIIKIDIGQIKIDRPVYLIFEDNNNNLWIGSDNGIYKWDGEEVNHYTVNNGLSGQETNRDAGLVDSYGNVWIGTNNGATLYREKSEIDEKKIPPPKIFIDYMLANNDTIYIKDDKIKLPYAKNNLAFHFTAISFINEDQIFYKCKLEGIDENWSAEFRSPNNQYRYNSILPGTYKFCVKAKNALGIWSKPVCTKNIKVNAPFWWQWWFLILIAFLIGGLTYLAFKIISQKSYAKKLQQKVNERTEQLKKDEKKLKDMNETKDRFFSIIAHDLKSPINAILGLTDVIKSEYNSLSEKELTVINDNIHSAASHTNNLLDNLLTWARSQNGTISFKPEVINITKVINKNIDVFNSLASRKNISIINLIESDIFIYADPNMIDTVIRNLLSNAVKFTFRDGRIIIAARTKNHNAEVCIKDNGKGMDKETMTGLFEIQEKANSKGTDDEPGTGLGLILCKEFIERNSGKIWAESDNGNGSMFCFSLPQAENPKE